MLLSILLDLCRPDARQLYLLRSGTSRVCESSLSLDPGDMMMMLSLLLIYLGPVISFYIGTVQETMGVCQALSVFLRSRVDEYAKLCHSSCNPGRMLDVWMCEARSFYLSPGTLMTIRSSVILPATRAYAGCAKLSLSVYFFFFFFHLGDMYMYESRVSSCSLQCVGTQ